MFTRGILNTESAVRGGYLLRSALPVPWLDTCTQFHETSGVTFLINSSSTHPAPSLQFAQADPFFAMAPGFFLTSIFSRLF